MKQRANALNPKEETKGRKKDRKMMDDLRVQYAGADVHPS